MNSLSLEECKSKIVVKFDFFYKHAIRFHWSIKEGAGAMDLHHNEADVFRGFSLGDLFLVVIVCQIFFGVGFLSFCWWFP